MKNKETQSLIQKWIKIYKREKDEHLIEIWNDEFKDNGTPRRKEDQARREAIHTLIGGRPTNTQQHTLGEWKVNRVLPNLIENDKGEVIATSLRTDVVGKTKYNSSDENEANAQRIVVAVNEYDSLKNLITDILNCAQGEGESKDYNVSNRLKVHNIKTMVVNYYLKASQK